MTKKDLALECKYGVTLGNLPVFHCRRIKEEKHMILSNAKNSHITPKKTLKIYLEGN